MVDQNLKIIGVLVIVLFVAANAGLLSMANPFDGAYKWGYYQTQIYGTGYNFDYDSVSETFLVPDELDAFNFSYCSGWKWGSTVHPPIHGMDLNLKDINGDVLHTQSVGYGGNYYYKEGYNDLMISHWGEKKQEYAHNTENDFVFTNHFEMTPEMFNNVPTGSNYWCYTYDLTNPMQQFEGEEVTLEMVGLATGVSGGTWAIIIADPYIEMTGVDPLGETEYEDANVSTEEIEVIENTAVRMDSGEETIVESISTSLNNNLDTDFNDIEIMIGVLVLAGILILLIYRGKI